MEVCFADVAQGSASIIVLGNRKAVVIDCGGRQTRIVLELLNRFQIDTIVRLIVTHNHADHSAGAASLLTAFPRRIEQIWMLFDTALQDSLFWRRVGEERAAGRLRREQIRRLERAASPQEVYRDQQSVLAVVAPDAIANFDAAEARNPNETSGVLILKRGDQRILFAGDSTIPEWRAIHSLDPRPFTCSVVTVPHHGGKVWEEQRSGEGAVAFAARVQADLDWLYGAAIRAKMGVVSVGSSNSYRHPRPEVMGALRRANVTPVCTQMTIRCEPDLEGQRRRSLPVALPGRSTLRTQRTSSGASANVACGGTLLVEVHANQMLLHRFNDHQAMVSRLPQVPGQRPLCRC